MTKKDIKDLTYQINGAAIEVHKQLGPGLLESVYHQCLEHELWHRGIDFQTELEVPISYKMIDLNTKLRCDLFVENTIIIEIKAIQQLAPVHSAQLLTYMKLLEAPKGILFNFNVSNLYKEGQKTMVNKNFESLPD